MESRLKNLFIGLTLSQLEKMKKQEKIEKEYMDFVYKNPNLKMSEYEAKYKKLNL